MARKEALKNRKSFMLHWRKEIDTYEEYRDSERFDQHLEINIFHSLYQDRVAMGTHIDHLSILPIKKKSDKHYVANI